MRVARWGNSLAVRLPADLVAALGVAEGDEIELVPDSDGRVRIRPDLTRKEVLSLIDKLARPLPAGYRFTRADAYEDI